MDLPTFQELLSSRGQRLLAAAVALEPSESRFLACYDKLRKQATPELVKSALETAILRRQAQAKFQHADRLYFTREALEQSSSEIVAGYRSRRYRGMGSVGDLCCGVGGDAIALAAQVPVVAVDRDPLRVAMAAANLDALGLTQQARVVGSDLLVDEIPRADAYFCDPARREGERRFRSLHDYSPTPDEILSRLPKMPIAFKLAPAVPWTDLDAFPGEVEFLSLGGELKEAVLWMHGLGTIRRRATVLPSEATLSADTPAPTPEITMNGGWIYDPDPAVTRAGLVTNLAEDLSARMIDSQIAFLIAEEKRPTPFAKIYEIDCWLPFHLKRLQEVLRERQVGRVTIVKRGSAIDAEDMRKRLKLQGESHRHLLLTRHLDQPVVIVTK